MRTWTTRPTPSANNGCLDCTWPRVELPLNPPPIDHPIPPQSREGWENDDVKVYTTYTPNPVATPVDLFSGESYEHGQNIAPHLNCLRLWDRGNGKATFVFLGAIPSNSDPTRFVWWVRYAGGPFECFDTIARHSGVVSTTTQTPPIDKR